MVGIDDWADKRGQTYGTILVDLEQHRVIDLLPDRTTETVAACLNTYPNIEVISRDRAGAYAEAARPGAPQAQQVADRWHLLQNLTEAVQRVVERHYPQLREIAQQTEGVQANQERQAESIALLPVPPSAAEQRRQTRQKRRQARCAEVLRLHAQGTSIQSIARQLRMHRRLVRQFILLGAVSPRTPYPRRPCELDAFADYLAQRWQEGCRNGTQLWRELRERGFRGSATRVRHWIAQYHRPNNKRGQQLTAAPLLPSPRQVTWILLEGPRPVNEQTKEWIQCFRQQVPDIQLTAQLATEFATLVREKRRETLPAWMERAAHSPLASFAAGLRRDLSAVEAACSAPWSQGQVEGQVNRLKMLKRQMYGRASFPLLRSRVLAAPNPKQKTSSVAA